MQGIQIEAILVGYSLPANPPGSRGYQAIPGCQRLSLDCQGLSLGVRDYCLGIWSYTLGVGGKPNGYQGLPSVLQGLSLGHQRLTPVIRTLNSQNLGKCQRNKLLAIFIIGQKENDTENNYLQHLQQGKWKMTQKITTCSIYNRANDELKYSLLGARRLKPIRAQKHMITMPKVLAQPRTASVEAKIQLWGNILNYEVFLSPF